MSKEPPPAGSQAEEALLAPVVLTAAQAAQMLQVSAQLIVRWARDGHLRVFVPPGGDLLGGHRGPKTYRFTREDVLQFVRDHTVLNQPLPPREDTRPRPAPADPVGSDGVRRMVRKGRARD